jgi:hypothetical protein
MTMPNTGDDDATPHSKRAAVGRPHVALMGVEYEAVTEYVLKKGPSE